MFDNFQVTVYTDFKNTLHSQKRPLIRLELKKPNDTIATVLEYKQDTLVVALKKICQFMDQTHTEWLEHIEKVRNTYTSINLFTTKQINFLKSALSSILLKQGTLEWQAFEQLGFLLFNLVKQDALTDRFIREVYVESLNELRKKRRLETNKPEPIIDPKKEEFVKAFASKNGVSDVVVRKAIELYGMSDETKLQDYCFLNDGMMDVNG